MALSPNVSGADGLRVELGQVVSRAAERFHVPGIAVAIVFGDDHLTATTGVTSVENPLAVDADTLFKIASVTKPITGTALMRLSELGRFDFDAPLRTYLPDLRLADEDAAARVTMRHVVTHRVGLFSRPKDFGRGDDALARWAAHLADLPARAGLDELFCYSWDFQLAGRVIEVLTGKTYEAAMTELVLEPLGMKHSCFFATDAITYRVASGHAVNGGRAQVVRPWPEVRSGHPSGGMLSTANDMIAFMRLHLGAPTSDGADRLLSDASIAIMASPLSPDGKNGVAWFRNQVDGLDIIDHGGGYPGFLAQLTLVPSRRFGIAVLTNITRTNAEDRAVEIHTVSGEIVAWAFGAYLDLHVPADRPLAMAAGELTEYAGTYVGQLSDVELSVADGCLIVSERTHDTAATRPDEYRVAFYDADRVFRLDGTGKDTRGQFLRDADGQLAWFRPFVATVYRRAR